MYSGIAQLPLHEYVRTKGGNKNVLPKYPDVLCSKKVFIYCNRQVGLHSMPGSMLVGTADGTSSIEVAVNANALLGMWK